MDHAYREAAQETRDALLSKNLVDKLVESGRHLLKADADTMKPVCLPPPSARRLCSVLTCAAQDNPRAVLWANHRLNEHEALLEAIFLILYSHEEGLLNPGPGAARPLRLLQLAQYFAVRSKPRCRLSCGG
jgi:hypothetical protein